VLHRVSHRVLHMVLHVGVQGCYGPCPRSAMVVLTFSSSSLTRASSLVRSATAFA